MAINTFEEVRFPVKVSFGFEGGARFKTSIATNHAGFEQRNIDWSLARWEFAASMDTKSGEELDEVKSFFLAMRGRGVGFRFFDHRDYCSDMDGVITGLQSGSVTINASTEVPDLPAAGVLTPVSIGTGDNSETDFQATKVYTVASLAGDAYTRTILKPYAGRLFVDGVEDGSATLDTTTGVFTASSAPGVGLDVTADFLFDVPCRFQLDYQPDTLDHFNIGQIRQIDMIELRNL
jgi:hypothetical protein